MKKINFFVCIFIFLSSCRLGENYKIPVKKESEPQFKMTRLWELEIESYGSEPYITDGFGYLIQGNSFCDNPYFFISKIDMSNGNVIWNSEKKYELVSDCIVKCGDYVFVYKANGSSNSGCIFAFSEKTGELCYELSDSRLDLLGGTTLIAYKEQYLLWPVLYRNGKDERFSSIIKLDVTNLESVTIDYTDSISGYINADLCLEENSGIVYYETMGDKTRQWHPVIGAINLETGSVLWTHEIRESFWPGGLNSLLIEKDRLYAMDSGLVCLNKNDGKTVYINLNEDFYSADYSGSIIRGESVFTRGFTFYENKIYLTNEASRSADKRYFRNIQCLNAKTGDFVWGDLPQNSGSLCSRPVVIDGKLLVTMYYQGLRMYDAKSGKLLGVDPSITNGGNGKNIMIDGILYVIVKDFEKKVPDQLCALCIPEK